VGVSPLNQINDGDVGQLRMVWSRAMVDGPQEVEPIAYNSVMFLAIRTVEPRNTSHDREIILRLEPAEGSMTEFFVKSAVAGVLLSPVQGGHS
jgi:hypothetical protein